MKTAQKFADVRFARWCYTQKIGLVALPRMENWLAATQQKDSIYNGFTLKNPPDVADEIRSFAFGGRPPKSWLRSLRSKR
jgi:hypothetical protein